MQANARKEGVNMYEFIEQFMNNAEVFVGTVLSGIFVTLILIVAIVAIIIERRNR